MIFFHKKPSEKQLLKIVDNDDSFVEREDGKFVRIFLYDPDENFTAIDYYKTNEFAERNGKNWVKYLRRMIELTHLTEQLLYHR